MHDMTRQFRWWTTTFGVHKTELERVDWAELREREGERVKNMRVDLVGFVSFFCGEFLVKSAY